MRAAGMVLRARLRQHGKSWLALAVLAALVGGLVMAATATARATAAAFPGFATRYGHDDIVFTARPLPQLARIPQVTQVTPVRVPWVAAVGCVSCAAINTSGSVDAFELGPPDLGRTVKLVAGQMPDQSDPKLRPSTTSSSGMAPPTRPPSPTNCARWGRWAPTTWMSTRPPCSRPSLRRRWAGGYWPG